MKGSIHCRKDLKKPWWFVRWYDDTDGRIHNITHYRGMRMYDRIYAEKLLAQMQGDYERGCFSINKYLLNESEVVPYLWEWLNLIKTDIAPGTYNNYLGYVKNHLEPFFMNQSLMLHEIQYDVLLKLLNSIRLSPKGKLNVMACLRTCLDFAWRSNRIQSIPPFPKRKYYNLVEPVINYVPEDRQMKIINAIPERHRTIFLFLKYHMRRPAEAMMLRKEDYDARTQEFIIHRGISAGKEVEYTKTKKVHRIPCVKEFAKIIENMTFEYPFSSYLFTCKESRHPHKRYTRDILKRLWEIACTQAGEKIGLYEGTKHSTCTHYLNDLKLSYEELKLITDHASVESVKKYGKVELSRKRELMEKGKVLNIRDRLGTEIPRKRTSKIK